MKPKIDEDPSRPKQIGVFGSRGFIGLSILDRCAKTSRDARGLSIKLSVDGYRNLASWRAENPDDWKLLVENLMDVDVLINAAGKASPDETDDALLWGANVLLPLILAAACDEAGVRRFVHLSSAAVQGRNSTLDESDKVEPFSSYSRTKAEAEAQLSLLGTESAVEIVVYRPTSVQGSGRPTTEALTRLLQYRWIPVLRGPERPLPLALVENVAELAIFLSECDSPPPTVLHPWERVTNRSAIALMGSPRSRELRVPQVTLGLLTAASHVSVLAGMTRRVELFLSGQKVDSCAESLGFRLPIGHDGYRALRPET